MRLAHARLGGALATPARDRRRWIIGSLVAALLVAAYALWPRIALWQLDRALVRDDRQALAAMVDLDAIRRAIRDRLNKESQSAIGPVSDAFIQWLEQAIRRNGTQALEAQINLDWVRGRLLAHSPPGTGLCGALTQSGFENPAHYALRIGAAEDRPVYARLSYRGTGWQLTAVYF